MSVDFEKQYQYYSEAELRAIIDEPHRYQPAAVRAAVNLLARRGSSADGAVHAALFTDQAYESPSVSIFEEDAPQYDPRQAAVARYVIIGIYGYYILSTVWSQLYLFRMLGTASFGLGIGSLMWSLGLLGLYVLTLVLLAQRKRAGWFLAMIISVLELCFKGVWVGFALFAGPENLIGSGIWNIINIVLAIVVVVMVLRPALREQLGISRSAASQTVGWSIAAALVLMTMAFLISAVF